MTILLLVCKSSAQSGCCIHKYKSLKNLWSKFAVRLIFSEKLYAKSKSFRQFHGIVTFKKKSSLTFCDQRVKSLSFFFQLSLADIPLSVNDLVSHANIEMLQPARDLETKIKPIYEFFISIWIHITTFRTKSLIHTYRRQVNSSFSSIWI